jgi:hypothetical protein
MNLLAQNTYWSHHRLECCECVSQISTTNTQALCQSHARSNQTMLNVTSSALPTFPRRFGPPIYKSLTFPRRLNPATPDCRRRLRLVRRLSLQYCGSLAPLLRPRFSVRLLFRMILGCDYHVSGLCGFSGGYLLADRIQQGAILEQKLGMNRKQSPLGPH